MDIIFGIVFAVLTVVGWIATIFNITYAKWPVPVITGLLTIASGILALALFRVI